MKKKGTETADVEVELNLARDKLKQGLFTMAENYVESVKNRLKTIIDKCRRAITGGKYGFLYRCGFDL